MAPAPAESATGKVNVCDDPLPCEGFTDTTCTGRLAGTVQEPKACHPIEPVGFAACRYTVLVPENTDWNVTMRFNVNTVPAVLTVEPLPFRTHWLFCWLPLPGVIVPAGAAPASVNNQSAFCARLYVTEHPLATVGVELNKVETFVRSTAPLVSAN